jgi:hypothetical protein
MGRQLSKNGGVVRLSGDGTSILDPEWERKLAMAEYMLFVRGGDQDAAALSPEAAQQRLQKYIDWSRRLREENRSLGANELASEGVVLRARGGEIVVDGPYAETKEAIGGYFHIAAADDSDALDIARQCPALEFGGAVEVRAIIDHS